MKKLLIINVPDIDRKEISPSRIGLTLPINDIHEASMVIYKSPTHFRCVKNRWAEDANEKIPNHLLKAYLMYYKHNFSVEDLIDSLL